MAPFSDELKAHDVIARETDVMESKIPELTTRRMAKDWSCYLTEESAARKPSGLKAAFKHLLIPGIISLGGGLPLPAYFPIHEVTVQVPSIGKWSEEETALEGSPINVVKYSHKPSATKTGVYTNRIEKGMGNISTSASAAPIVGLSTTLQYGLGTGEPHLISFLKHHTKMVHNPPYEDWSTTLTCGNTYSFYTCLRMLLNKGDYIVMEEFAYCSAVDTVGPLGIKIVGIEMDEQGMTATGLDYTLSNWEIASRGAGKPRVIYIVPTGQNPTGASMLLQRRKDIYRVCQKHDLVIVEDDPYYFLQMESYNGKPTPLPDQSATDLINNLIPSLMSLDVDGRVLRLDSLSKTIAPGLRLAWLSGPSLLIERAIRHLEITTQAPSGLSQSVAYELLARHWNHDGFLGWLGYIRKEYTRRRDTVAEAMEKYLPKEVVSWTVPSAGMFFWVKITAPAAYKYPGNLETNLFERCLAEKVLVIPGGFFKADSENVGVVDGVCYFRGTFAAVEEREVVRGLERLGRSIRSEFGLEMA